MHMVLTITIQAVHRKLQNVAPSCQIRGDILPIILNFNWLLNGRMMMTSMTLQGMTIFFSKRSTSIMISSKVGHYNLLVHLGLLFLSSPFAQAGRKLSAIRNHRSGGGLGGGAVTYPATHTFQHPGNDDSNNEMLLDTSPRRNLRVRNNKANSNSNDDDDEDGERITKTPKTNFYLSIMRPFAHDQIPALVTSFEEWTNLYPPGIDGCAGGYHADVVISFSRPDDGSEVAADVHRAFEKIQALFIETNGWNGCITAVDLQFCDILPEEDLYSSWERGGAMWVNGPNRQVCTL